MANQTLQSANFTINYDPAALPKSTTRANALFAVIENEFATLCGWFGVTGGFGAGNRVVVNFVLEFVEGWRQQQRLPQRRFRDDQSHLA